MSRIAHLNRALAVAVALSTALWLSGCGGSSKATSQTSSQTSATSVTKSPSTQTNSSSPTQNGSTSTTQSTTTATSSASAARVANARAHALKMYGNCLRRHDINPKSSVETPQEKPVVSACIASVEAYFKAATR